MADELEEWRTCFFGLYQASSLGRLRRIGGRKAIMSQCAGSTGYPKVTIFNTDKNRVTISVHQLVAEAFIGQKPEGHCVNHIDADKCNNKASNLEYVTQVDNIKHAMSLDLMAKGNSHGRYTQPERSARGERIGSAVLSSDQVIAIRSMRDGGATFKEIAEKFKISKSQAFNIGNRKQWSHIK